MKPVYLDNNATTRPDPEAVAAIALLLRAFRQSVVGACLRRPRPAGDEEAREQVAALVGAGFPDEILFTSGGTESDNAAIRAGLAANPDRDEVVVSAVEHPAVLALVRRLDSEGRIKAHVIPVLPCGSLDRERYRAALSERVALVSIMWANNETGVVFPVDGARRRGEGGRSALSRRRRAGRRTRAHPSQGRRDRPPVALVPQAAWTQGRRRALSCVAASGSNR